MMSMILLVLVAIFAGARAAQFPPNFPRCNQIYKLEEQLAFKKCFIAAAKKAQPFLTNGLKEIGIPPLKNIVVPSIEVQQHARAIAFVATLSNVTVSGLENFNVREVILDPTHNWHLKLDVFLPKVELDGSYKVVGRLLNQKLEQSGAFTAVLEDTLVKIDVITIPYKRKGIEYVDFEKFIVDPQFSKAVGKLHNLFGNNEILNNALNQFLEGSTTYLLESVKPDIIKLIDSLVQTVGRSITSKIPWAEVFLQPK